MWCAGRGKEEKGKWRISQNPRCSKLQGTRDVAVITTGQVMWKRTNEETEGCVCCVTRWHRATGCAMARNYEILKIWNSMKHKAEIALKERSCETVAEADKASLENILWWLTPQLSPRSNRFSTQFSTSYTRLKVSGVSPGQINNKNGTRDVPVGSAASQEE